MVKETNGRPWYIRIIELVMSKEGLVGVFALVLLGLVCMMLWQNHTTITQALKASQGREERSTEALEGLTKSFGIIGPALEDLAKKASAMELVPTQRQALHDERMAEEAKHHEERMQEERKQSASLVKLEGESVPGDHKKMLDGQQKLLDGQKEIKDRLPKP